jgi:hypothetical protein
MGPGSGPAPREPLAMACSWNSGVVTGRWRGPGRQRRLGAAAVVVAMVARARGGGVVVGAGAGHGDIVAFVAHDLIAAGRRVLAEGLPDPPARLSRRHRLVALAADVDGDAAAVLFARRGVNGQPCSELVFFEDHGGVWDSPGGSGGTAEDDILADRPAAAELGAPLRWEGSGSCRSHLPSRRFPWQVLGLGGGRWLHHVHIRAAAETGEVRVRGERGERTIIVPRHGQLVVVWCGRAAPTLTAWSDRGVRIGSEVSVAAAGW